jgi:hypothetical protein
MWANKKKIFGLFSGHSQPFHSTVPFLSNSMAAGCERLSQAAGSKKGGNLSTILSFHFSLFSLTLIGCHIGSAGK